MTWHGHGASTWFVNIRPRWIAATKPRMCFMSGLNWRCSEKRRLLISLFAPNASIHAWKAESVGFQLSKKKEIKYSGQNVLQKYWAISSNHFYETSCVLVNGQNDTWDKFLRLKMKFDSCIHPSLDTFIGVPPKSCEILYFLSIFYRMPCDEPATCPGCHPAFALWQLGEAPAATHPRQPHNTPLSSGRNRYWKWMDRSNSSKLTLHFAALKQNILHYPLFFKKKWCKRPKLVKLFLFCFFYFYFSRLLWGVRSGLCDFFFHVYFNNLCLKSSS